MANLVSPGVQATVTDRSVYSENSPGTTPLIVLATRANKTNPDNSAIAVGTTESEKLRLVTSQRELLQNYGIPTFATENGVPDHGNETNEYGLLAAHSFLGLSQRAYVIRADIDLGALVPTTEEPSLPPPDGTYWIQPSNVTGGIFKFDGTSWVTVPFKVYTVSPLATDGNDDDWAFDLSTANATIMFKKGGTWLAATSTNVASAYAGATLHVGATAPASPSAGDFWYKTTASGGGVNWNLKRYRAVDNTFVTMPVFSQPTQPTPNNETIWEDTSQILTNGSHPLKIGTGTQFIDLVYFVQEDQPRQAPEDGTPWFNDTITDFAMYMEGTDVGRGNEWVPIETTTVNNPSRTQKVISGSAPTLPQEGAIWIDISTPENLDKFPVVKRYQSGSWIDITASVIVSDEDPVASSVVNGTYWVNTGAVRTRNIVKIYDPTYTAVDVVFDSATNTYVTKPVDGWHWKPHGTVFGRKSVRAIVVERMQKAIAQDQDIRSEIADFNLIAAPGYPELYDEMVTLNVDRGETAFVVADTPKFMSPFGNAQGREITIAEWTSNVRGAKVTGEDGFASARYPYAGFWYPWCMTTNVDGTDVMAPPSHMILRVLAYSDATAAEWFPPAGLARGRITNASSVGYLTDSGEYRVVALPKAARDTLYTNDINPIPFIPSAGLVVYGQKTFAGSNTALDRINVARLVLKIKRDAEILLAPFLMEPNDPTTRRSAKLVMERYLSHLLASRALTDMIVRCSSINNPPEAIDRNELHVDVLIKPTKAVEFIYVPITILNTGAAL
ncbi:MAG: hypothetical protein D6698_12445 [Gammaproteobacteria bacterium]|nr:MAG: hypothetical protein D6698_12445 [Gammaproteobacteria bacterium]